METCIALGIVGSGDEGEKVVKVGGEHLTEKEDEKQELQVAAWLVAAEQRFGLKSQSGSAWLPCLLIAPLWLQRLGPAGHQGTTLERWVMVGRRG